MHSSGRGQNRQPAGHIAEPVPLLDLGTCAMVALRKGVVLESFSSCNLFLRAGI